MVLKGGISINVEALERDLFKQSVQEVRELDSLKN